MKKFYNMKNTSKQLLLGISAIVLTGLIILFARKKTTRMLHEVSEEGYETAQDVLYPRMKTKYRKLHYGPVLPAL